MTAMTPRSSVRARMRRGVHRLALFAVAAGVVAMAIGGGASFASAETTTEEETTAVVSLHLSVGTNGVIAQGSPLLATATLTNDTGTELSVGHLTVDLNRTALTDDASVTAWLDNGTASGTFETVRAEDSAAVSSADPTSTALTVSSEELGTLAPGVYPLRAALRGATTGSATAGTLVSRDASASTVLIVGGDATAQVTVIVPLTATPEDGELLTAKELTALTAEDGALTAQLDAVSGTAAVIAIDPSILAAIRALGSSAPPSALAWLARWEALPNERFSLQFGDADVAVQAHAGLGTLLEPTSLSSYLVAENFAAEEDGSEATASPSPTPSPTPTEDPLPDDAELTEVARSAPGVFWPLSDVTSADLQTFSSYTDAEAMTILPSAAFADARSAHGVVDGSSVFIADDAASTAFSRAAAETDNLLRDDALAAGVSALTLAAETGSVLVTLDRDETRTADALSDTLAAIAAAGTSAGLAALHASAADTVTLRTEPLMDRASALTTLLADETELTSFSSILDDPQVLLGPERIRILRLLAPSAAETFDDAVAAHRKQTQDTLDAVNIKDPGPIQLFTSAAPLPVWISNDLPWPVNVRLTSTTSDPRLEIQRTTEVTAQHGGNTSVSVPIEARVGSGEVQVRFSLTSPTGVSLGDDKNATVTVRAEWEGIGLGILGTLIALLLIVGIVRTVLRRRREKRGGGAAKGGPPMAPATDGEPDE